MNLELERKKLERRKVDMAKCEMEFTILERLSDIERIKTNIANQEARIVVLDAEILEMNNKKVIEVKK